MEKIKEVALTSWNLLWETRIGVGNTSVILAEIDVPATVIGYFFEKLLARELEVQFPDQWRGNLTKDEKDLVYIPDPSFSVEVKSSGQLGDKIFGNRSYGKRSRDEGQIFKPEKSGYYITVNFYRQTLTLLRFGWIDFNDWKSQSAESGQAATLSAEAYRYKLIDIPGAYRLQSPVGILKGVGSKTLAIFVQEGVTTVQQLLSYRGDNKFIKKFKEQALTLARENE